MTTEKRKALFANGYREFKVSAPGRPEFAEQLILAPDAKVAGNKFRAGLDKPYSGELKIEQTSATE